MRLLLTRLIGIISIFSLQHNLIYVFIYLSQVSCTRRYILSCTLSSLTDLPKKWAWVSVAIQATHVNTYKKFLGPTTSCNQQCLSSIYLQSYSGPSQNFGKIRQPRVVQLYIVQVTCHYQKPSTCNLNLRGTRMRKVAPEFPCPSSYRSHIFWFLLPLLLILPNLLQLLKTANLKSSTGTFLFLSLSLYFTGKFKWVYLYLLWFLRNCRKLEKWKKK